MAGTKTSQSFSTAVCTCALSPCLMSMQLKRACHIIAAWESHLNNRHDGLQHPWRPVLLALAHVWVLAEVLTLDQHKAGAVNDTPLVSIWELMHELISVSTAEE
jgi:hypothetical protein